MNRSKLSEIVLFDKRWKKPYIVHRTVDIAYNMDKELENKLPKFQYVCAIIDKGLQNKACKETNLSYKN